MEKTADRPGIVYVVTDVREPARVRYVGRTIQPLDKRVWSHWRQARTGPRVAFQNWLLKRIENPETVRFTILSSHPNLAETDEAEITAIARFRAQGMADLNVLDGGQGATGGTWTEDRRSVQMAVVPRGERHYLSKLTWDEVRGIRDLRQREWVSSRELAEKYGVSTSQITSILRNKEWVDDDFDPSLVVRRVRSGEGAYHRSLDWASVRSLRDIATARYVSPYELASRFGTSQPNVRDILANKTWVDAGFDPSRVVRRPTDYAPTDPPKRQTRLTQDQVIAMRHRFRAGASLKELATEYGVIPNSVSRIVTGGTWGHVRDGLK